MADDLPQMVAAVPVVLAVDNPVGHLPHAMAEVPAEVDVPEGEVRPRPARRRGAGGGSREEGTTGRAIRGRAGVMGVALGI